MMGDLLHQLRTGKVDAETLALLGSLPAEEFVSDLRPSYPVLFQQRAIGAKREVGMARAI
jgi:hypothetical protein